MRIVFDIETVPFSEKFKRACSREERLRHAPVPRVVCVLHIETEKYRFYSLKSLPSFCRILASASEVITFNGEGFDFLVLQKHLGITRRALTKAKSVDLHSIASARAGFKVSLDLLARLNLNKEKILRGDDYRSASIRKLRTACKLDVTLTYRLYQREIKGLLKVPQKHFAKKIRSIPTRCPECEKEVALKLIDADLDEMTEGQAIEYNSGLWGYAYCPKCRNTVFWESNKGRLKLSHLLGI